MAASAIASVIADAPSDLASIHGYVLEPAIFGLLKNPVTVRGTAQAAQRLTARALFEVFVELPQDPGATFHDLGLLVI